MTWARFGEFSTPDLQFLEQDESDSYIVAATNCVAMLDEALFRRFDDVIRYVQPTAGESQRLIRNRLHMFLPAGVGWKRVQETAAGLSHAEIARACDDAAKACIINDKKHVSTESLADILSQRVRP